MRKKIHYKKLKKKIFSRNFVFCTTKSIFFQKKFDAFFLFNDPSTFWAQWCVGSLFSIKLIGLCARQQIRWIWPFWRAMHVV